MIEWKKVKINFKTVKLGDFIEKINTRVVEVDDKKYRNVYGVTNIYGITKTGKIASKDISRYKIIDKNYIAYNPYRINVGSIGVNSSGKKGCVSPAYVVFRTKPTLDSNFLYLYLRSEFGNHLINWYGNKGGVRSSLKYKDLCNIDIPNFSLSKQNEFLVKINKIIGKIKLLNEQKDNQIVLLNQYKKSILQEAVEGKLTADWRKKHTELINGENSAENLLKKIKIEKEQLIKEKKIKKTKKIQNTITERNLYLPDGWVYCKADEVFFITKLAGFEYTKYVNLKKTGEIPVIRAQNVRPLNINKNNLLYIDKLTSDNLNRSSLTKPCLLVTFIGAGIGDVATFDESTRWHLAPNVAKMELFTYESTKLNLRYINYFLLSKIGKNEICKHIKATAQPSLSMGTIRDIDLIIPSFLEQQAIVEQIDNLMNIVNKLEKQVIERKEKTTQLMHSVLREAFEQKQENI
jgi:type I restriction enzyme S subunit